MKTIPTGGTTSDKVGLLLPYSCSDPLLPNEKSRIAPALSKALMMCKEAGHEPQRVTHVIFPGDIPLPADLRRWDTAYSERLTINELQNQSSDTISVLAIRYPFFGNRKSNNFDPMVWFPKALDLLVPKGVLWLCAVTPLDMPTNWIFQFFPGAWQWAQQHTWGLMQLYTNLQLSGFQEIRLQRHLWHQTMTAGTMLKLAREKTGPLAELPQAAYQQGLDKIQNGLGEKTSYYSELAVVEIWTQKSTT